MKRPEFLEKVHALTNQLNDLVNSLPNIPSLEENDDNIEQSKTIVLSAILSVEMDSEQISDLYFDKD